MILQHLRCKVKYTESAAQGEGREDGSKAPPKRDAGIPDNQVLIILKKIGS
jgi:hypothetical protein